MYLALFVQFLADSRNIEENDLSDQRDVLQGPKTSVTVF